MDTRLLEVVGLSVTALCHVGLAVSAVGHILLTRREPTAAVLWLLWVMAVPVLGPVIYGLGGWHRRNRRNRLRFQRRLSVRERHASLELTAARRKQHLAQAPEHIGLLSRAVGHVSDRPLLSGNAVDLLRNGEQTYPRMLEAMEAAKSSIHLLSYIFDEDETGKQFLDCLAAAAARGVETRLLYDAVGAYETDETFFAPARRAGVKVAEFRPLRLTRWRRGLHFRNHRKVLVVDGLVGFTGGLNISERYLAEKTDNPDRCRDFHVRVVGPVVGQLQEVFMEDWFEASGEALLGDRYYPDVGAHGDALCRVITSTPVGEYERIHAVYFQALSVAQQSVDIVTPYFIPDTAIMTAMRAAVQRGVRVRVLIPGEGDSPFVQHAAMGTIPELLSAGVSVFIRQPPFIHAKGLVMDGAWATVGSANFDARSFRFNDECNLEVIHGGFCASLSSAMEDERSQAVRFTAEDWGRQPLSTRLLQRASALFGPTL